MGQGPGEIARRYLRTWFTIDLVSVASPASTSSQLEATNEEGQGLCGRLDSSLGQLEILRVVRVLRLIKLARLLRASKLLQRWQTKLNIDYATGFSFVIGDPVHNAECMRLGAQVTFLQNLSQTWMGDDGYCVPAILAGSCCHRGHPFFGATLRRMHSSA